jgi:general secretion pathway protein A
VDHDRSSERPNGYERFFGFHQPPFSLAPDTRFRFQSASHAAALAHVTYALERREPVVVVTGEIGTGKTLLCRTVVERLERKTFLSIVTDPLLEHDDLLKQMLQDFGVVSKDRTKLTPTSRHDLVHALQEFLSSLATLRAHAIVIIDEAQHVQPDVLEQIRLVSNIQDERGTMLQIILVGQTDLDRLLSRPELRALKQRVSRSVRLDALSPAEVAQYIDHRLSVARERPTQSSIPGARELEREIAEWDRSDSDATFTPEAVHAVAQLSRGIPRVVNLLCDRALEAAYARELRAVDASLIGTAAQALPLPAAPETAASLSLESPPSLEWPQLVPTAVPAPDAPPIPDHAPRANRYVIVAASLVLAGAAIWYGGRAMNQRGSSEPASPPAAAIQPTTRPETAPSVAPPRGDVEREPPLAATTSAGPPPPQPTGTAATSVESTGEAFEIVVASFRTAARATDVAAQVAALGLPVRQRFAGGWQQVLAGPYGSAVQARDAQQRLQRAGFTGTQLLPVAR